MTGKVIYNVFEAVNLAKPVKDWLTYQGEYVTDGNGQVIFVDGLVKYASSDGIDDKLINADCSSLINPSFLNFKITGKVRSTSTGLQYLKTGNSFIESLSIVVESADTWENFEITGLTDTTSLNNLSFGTRSGPGGDEFSTADWRDIKLINYDTDEVVANWPLDDQSSGDLDGVTAIDVVGGFDGVHIGGTGGFEAI